MDLINSLLNLLKEKQTVSKEDIPQGYCPNCWGRQEYGGQFFEAVKNNNVDVNSPNPNVGWIQDYANKHLSAIELKHEDDMLICRKCKLTYRPT